MHTHTCVRCSPNLSHTRLFSRRVTSLLQRLMDVDLVPRAPCIGRVPRRVELLRAAHAALQLGLEPQLGLAVARLLVEQSDLRKVDEDARDEAHRGGGEVDDLVAVDGIKRLR